MASPLDHYPAEADFVALWREICQYRRERRARKLLHVITLKLQTSERVIANADEANSNLKTAGRFYRIRAADHLSMLDTWCREAQELLDDCNSVLRGSLSQSAHTKLESAWCTLVVTTWLASIARDGIETALDS